MDNDPLSALDAADFAFTRRAWVPASPTAMYDLISDVSRIGEWSPNAYEVRYDVGAGPEPGAWFGGRNRRGDSGWESRSQVLTAERGTEFSFVVKGSGVDDGVVRWRWTFRADGTGTVVEQSWQLLRMHPLFGPTRREVTDLQDEMATSAETTLLALTRWVTESS